MNLTIKDIFQAVGGKNEEILQTEFSIEQVEFDTRKVVNNTLFIPLKGNRDGHEFIEQAFSMGACLTLSDRPLEMNLPYILVEDTLKAFQELAKFYLKKINPKVCAITGSNGKTTTKDMTASVLSTTFKTYKTQGNYNNEIGLPYTIMSIDEQVEVLVLEMGMDRKGDIELLTSIGQPDVAAITMIGESHIEHLGSRSGIASAKMEIVSGLKKDGTLIVPEDEPLLKPLLKEVTQQVKTFGLTDEGDYLGAIVEETKNHTTFTVNRFKGEVFSIPVLGKYNVGNALIAMAVGEALGVPVENIKQGLATFDLTKNRTEWLETKNGVQILSDVYNANPTAMKLVLDSFSKIKSQGRKIAVLGDMLELGPDSGKMHQSVGAHIDPSQIDVVYLYGSEMKHLYADLKGKYPEEKLAIYDTSEKEEMTKAIGQEIKSSDTVFLKASNGMGLKEVVDNLLNNH